jgi:hypothetical protein
MHHPSFQHVGTTMNCPKRTDDNAQLWNQTTTNATSMAYCELRFPQSPAQLLASGLLGNLTPLAFLAFGTYLASWPTGSILSFACTRRAQVAANAQLVGPSSGFYGTTFTPQATAVLDSASYGGYNVQASVGSGGWNPRAFVLRPANASGIYHLFGRYLTKQALANLAKVQVRVVTQQLSDPWYGNANGTDQLGSYNGPFTAPLASSNAWTVVDAGQGDSAALQSRPADGSRTDISHAAHPVDGQHRRRGDGTGGMADVAAGRRVAGGGGGEQSVERAV